MHARALCTTAAILGLSGFTLASAVQTRPVVVSLTYDLPRSVTLHEPVLMDLVLHNGSSVPAFVDISHPGSFTFEVTTPAGRRVVAAIREFQGEAFEGADDVPAGYHFEHQVALDGFLDFSEPGSYRIIVRFGGRIEPREVGARVVVPPPTREFTLVVRPRDEERLREICEAVMPDLKVIGTVQGRAAKRLAWVQDPVAVPYLKRAVEVFPEYRQFWEAFVRIGSAEARQALLELSQQSANPHIAARAKSTLERIVRAPRRR